jgi:hypothetical protein
MTHDTIDRLLELIDKMRDDIAADERAKIHDAIRDLWFAAVLTGSATQDDTYTYLAVVLTYSALESDTERAVAWTVKQWRQDAAASASTSRASIINAYADALERSIT